VVGDSTADALRARGAEADFVPEEANGASLGAALPDASGARVLLVRASLAGADLPAVLRSRGAFVDELTVYETVEGPAESLASLGSALSQPDLAAVVFASGSALRGFIKLGGRTDLPAVTIGPRTTAIAQEAGFAVVVEAASPNVRGLAAAVSRAIPIEVRGHRDA
jgi:uroporphyrinogen III methyltransferase/synthase